MFLFQMTRKCRQEFSACCLRARWQIREEIILWKKKKPRQKIICLEQEEKKGRTQIKSGKAEGRWETILEIMLLFPLSCRLIACANCNVSFVACVDSFPVKKLGQILPKSPPVSGLWGGQIVAACYKGSYWKVDSYAVLKRERQCKETESWEKGKRANWEEQHNKSNWHKDNIQLVLWKGTCSLRQWSTETTEESSSSKTKKGYKIKRKYTEA